MTACAPCWQNCCRSYPCPMPMVLRSVVERSISMSVVRRRISIARKSIFTVGSSGRGLSISVARRSISIPMTMMSISTRKTLGVSLIINKFSHMGPTNIVYSKDCSFIRTVESTLVLIDVVNSSTLALPGSTLPGKAPE